MKITKDVKKGMMALVSVGALMLLPHTSYAICQGIQLSAYGGASQITHTTPSDLVISPLETDTFHKIHADTAFTPGLGAAYNFVFAPNPCSDPNNIIQSASLGLDAFYVKAKQKGDVYQFDNPDFDNYDYKLKLKSTRLMLNGELTAYSFWQGLNLFVEAGVGVARNTLGYEDTPEPGINGGGIELSNHTQNKFAWDVGGGVKAPLANNIVVSLRYLYTNLGRVETAAKGSLDIEKPVKLNAQTQTVLLGLSYIIV